MLNAIQNERIKNKGRANIQGNAISFGRSQAFVDWSGNLLYQPSRSLLYELRINKYRESISRGKCQLERSSESTIFHLEHNPGTDFHTLLSNKR